MGRTKAQSSGLGKALLNRRAKEANVVPESKLYMTDENPLQSVTHEEGLDEFLSSAALADTDFTAERNNTKIISTPSLPQARVNPYLLSKAEEAEVKKKQKALVDGLRVPRRPAWTTSTTRLQLEAQERTAFLDWRRGLAELAASSSLLLTPFERNLQLWRQLWRVLERSHLIVQIVDARNPAGFRCVDLEKYVQEVGSGFDNDAVSGGGKRKSLLLVNKADLLTRTQREAWADYFESQGVEFAFFSAANAAALQEQAERQRRREAGEDVSDIEDDEDEDEEEESEVEVEEENAQVDEDEESEVDSEEDEAPKTLHEAADLPSQQTALEEQMDATTLTDEELEDTDGEDETAEKKSKPTKGAWLAIAEVEPDAPESDRTRVISVTELEELFERSAPDLKHFATERNPEPEKLIVGLVGYPNVGKSSTINALLGSKKVSVSSTPGKTKHFQTLVFSPKITLCDCPGLVFPQFANTQADMVIDGVLPIDQMREYSAPAELVCQRIERDILEGTYGIRIDVREVEDGGTGRVGWEDLLSAYAIARGLTRASFGMPDTSRAARYVLKDYVNARLLYAHPPPGMDADEYMSSSREQTRAMLEAAHLAGKKRAPVTRVGKGADTFVAAAPADPLGPIPAAEDQPGGRQATSKSVRQNAASAPDRSASQTARALDGSFFAEEGPAARPQVLGALKGGKLASEQGGYSRSTMYPHQRMLGPDGTPVDAEKAEAMGMVPARAKPSKKHYKGKEGKQRSGRGYDL